MKNAVVALILLSSLSSLAALKIPSETEYQSGRTLCEGVHAELVKHEKGFYTKVPVDYKNPQKGSTDVYAFFANGFDPKKETLIYFTGGPGLTSHWGLFRYHDVSFNVLIMDQRGIACSRPATRALYLNPDFYSSEAVARDAEMIRQGLKIQKWAVYGISYGTVPATIYASLFPQSTQATILEGVLFAGELDLWAAPNRRELLQKMLNTLPVNILARMNDISVKYGVPNTWFSRYSRQSLMKNDGLRKLREEMLRLGDDKDYQEYVELMKSYYVPPAYEPHPLFSENELPASMISCQELVFSSSTLVTEDAFVKGKLSPVINMEAPKDCRLLGATKARTYTAKDYPVSGPVTYFQGSDDSATPAPLAMKHFQQVPTGNKQLLLLQTGGHNPSLEAINGDEENQLEAFTLAVKGQKIPEGLLKDFGKDSVLKWSLSSEWN